MDQNPVGTTAGWGSIGQCQTRSRKRWERYSMRIPPGSRRATSTIGLMGPRVTPRVDAPPACPIARGINVADRAGRLLLVSIK